ncbi:hypothetical protein [Phytohabitans kaempferiae]|uniref:Uncharacterized protein n=1 Tax=Phytohabitans kaempferiae TaxID=1620943 RepID=A0ABV6MGL6_9ACTN
MSAAQAATAYDRPVWRSARASAEAASQCRARSTVTSRRWPAAGVPSHSAARRWWSARTARGRRA